LTEINSFDMFVRRMARHLPRR